MPLTGKRQRLAERDDEKEGQQENESDLAATSSPAASKKDASLINKDCEKYWRLKCLVCKVNRRDTSLNHAIICEPCFLSQPRNSGAAASSSQQGVAERSQMPIDYTKTLVCGLECDTRMTRKGSNARFVCLRTCFRDSGHSGACRCAFHCWLSVDMNAVDESIAEVDESDEEGNVELDDGGN